MSATTTQLLSSGEFCKLRYDTTPVKSASANVSFYTSNSKMSNFELWHTCRKWAISIKLRPIVTNSISFNETFLHADYDRWEEREYFVGGGNIRHPTVRYSCVAEEGGLIQRGAIKKMIFPSEIWGYRSTAQQQMALNRIWMRAQNKK
jgi:hypothetical protein